MGYKILKEVSLERFFATGKTRHFSGNIELPKPDFLQIVKYEDDTGYYLFYLNGSKECMTDTYHETIKNAIDQAQWEFGVDANDWEEVNV